MSDMTTRTPPIGSATIDDETGDIIRTPRSDTSRNPDRSMDRGAAERSAFSFRDREETAARNSAPFRSHDKREADESIPSLVRRLTEQGSHLAQQQTKLIEAEVRSSVNDLKESIGAMAGAGVVGIAGLGVLLMGLSFLLAEAMPLWLATMIVAGATLASAYFMFSAGRKKLQSSAMNVDRTKRTLERAPDAISGNSKEVRNNVR